MTGTAKTPQQGDQREWRDLGALEKRDDRYAHWCCVIFAGLKLACDMGALRINRTRAAALRLGDYALAIVARPESTSTLSLAAAGSACAAAAGMLLLRT